MPHRPSLHITACTDFASLLPLRDEWNRLLTIAETNTIFQTFEWHQCWWESFGNNRDLLVLLLRDNGELIGIAPLEVTEKRVNGLSERVLGFIGAGNYSSDYCDFIVRQDRPDTIVAILDWLSSSPSVWTQMDLFNLPSHSRHVPLILEHCSHNGSSVISYALYDAPAFVFGDSKEDRKILRKKSMRRHFNYFTHHGELLLKHCGDREEILSLLEVCFRQHIHRWANTASPSIFLDPQQQRFYRCLVRALDPKDCLRFSLLLYNGEPLAFHFGFEYQHRYIWYKPTFDVSYAKHSPGEVMLKFLLEYAMEKKLKEFDFTIGEEVYKYRFSNTIRSNHRVLIFRRRLAYALMKLRRRMSPVRRLLKRSAPVSGTKFLSFP